MDNQTAWVDAGRCAGCGTCVPICPVDAIAAVNGKARVDDGCTGCAACVDVCPEGAIQLAIQGELVAVPERAIPIPYRPSPLVETAGTATLNAGAALDANFGPLTFSQGGFLTTTGTPMAFANSTIAPGTTVAGIDPQTATDIGLLTADGTTDVVFSKLGGGDLLLGSRWAAPSD